MERRITSYTTDVCTAIITVKGNIMKQYGDNTYYLRNGQEFEIQLNNPTKSVVAAKILMNGKAISEARIILKPGQKVHLDRYINEPKKFLFETYEVEDSLEAKKAIEDNGSIQVKFYKEKIVTPTVTYTVNNPIVWDSMDFMGGGTSITNGTTNVNNFYSSSHEGQAMMSTNSMKGGQHVNSVSKGLMRSAGGASASIETGRVEKGSDSKQRFKDYIGEFEYNAFQTTSIKLLPVQYKPTSIAVLAEYCVQCGTKNKKGNYKFCPKCGTRY